MGNLTKEQKEFRNKFRRIIFLSIEAERNRSNTVKPKEYIS